MDLERTDLRREKCMKNALVVTRTRKSLGCYNQRVLETVAEGAILILIGRPEAITIAQNREDLKDMREAARARAGVRERGEAEAEVMVVTSKEK